MLIKSWLAKSGMLFFCLLGLSANSHSKPELSDVSLQLRWHHQFQFAGFYMALEKGYYEQAGLSVDLFEGSGNKRNTIENVITNKASFGISNSILMLEYIRGAPLVGLAAIFQKSPSIWIVPQDSGIYAASDFIGRTARIVGDNAELKAMFLYEDINLDDINFVSHDRGLEKFISGDQAALEGYITNQPYLLNLQGIKHRIIKPIQYGIDFYGDTLFTSKAFAEKNPNTVNAFVEASLKGWEYAFSHEDETIAVIKEKYAPGKSLEHLKYEAREMRKLVMPDLISIGHMNPRRWLFIAESYKNLGFVNGDFNLADFIYNKDASINYARLIKWAVFLSVFAIIGWIAVAWYMSINKRLNAQIKERKAVEVEREKLIHSLQTALEEIKTLKGILPICSYCYQIRDDEGSWDELESYISRNSDAIVTHGVCPDCITRVANETDTVSPS